MEEEITMPSGGEAAESPVHSPLAATITWLRDLSLSILIAVIVILFLYQPVKVEGTSMQPGLSDNERIFINKFVYKFGLADIGHGDTIVFWYPNDTTKSYIKRVIAVPGDTVEVREGAVIVNGNQIPEPYVPEDFRDTASTPARHLAADEYFVLGDHRTASNDSRAWGIVPRKYIYGKAVFAYWPLKLAGMVR